VTFTARVVPASATGTVHFLEGTAELGLASLSGGIATVSISSLSLGSHTLTAKYDGDALVTGGTSAPFVQQISGTTAAISLFASSNSSFIGQQVDFVAAVAPNAATGNVLFYDGVTLMATVPLSNGAAGWSTSALAVGLHSIKAVYAGDGNYGSVASDILLETVNKLATATSLSSGKNPALFGQPVTFAASVSPAAATGSVSFFDAATLLGSANLNSGLASLTLSNLAIGNHQITAVYGGSATYGTSTSTGITQVINASADLSVTQTASSSSIAVGRRLTYTVVVANSGPNTATSISLTDILPSSVSLNSAKSTQGVCSGTATVTCSLGSLSSGGTVTVSIIVTPNAAGTIANSASAGGLEGDPAPGNNNSSINTQVTAK
jgi:uncharacterized repeat protein (TIGR01451 family)